MSHLVAVILLLLVAPLTTVAQGIDFVPGDVNDDSIVDVLDATVLRRALAELGPGITQTCSIACGDGVLDAGEECELGTLEGASCASLGFAGGTLACAAGTCLFDTSGCTPPACDPLNPEPICGVNTHCMPQPDNAPTCEGPAGPGTQGQSCLSDANCNTVYICLDSGGGQTCHRWCVVGGSPCPGSLSCFALDPPLYAGGSQYGICF